MDLTPRQTFAIAYFVHIDRLDMMRARLAIAALGAQGESAAIQSQLKEWEP